MAGKKALHLKVIKSIDIDRKGRGEREMMLARRQGRPMPDLTSRRVYLDLLHNLVKEQMIIVHSAHSFPPPPKKFQNLIQLTEIWNKKEE